jgi:pSer/pThr/pTyr-binding forkhead associated (FHA) protein
MTTQQPTAYLIIKDVEGERRNLLITNRSYIVGRSPQADIQLSDQRASREHAMIRLDNSFLRVTDSGSRNGTIVKGSRTNETWLRSGESMFIGSSELVFFHSETQTSGLTVNDKVKSSPRASLQRMLLICSAVILVGVVLIVSFSLTKKNILGDREHLKIENEVNLGFEKSSNKPVQRKGEASNDVDGQKGKEYYRLGLLFYDSGHLKKAIDHWDLALVFDPSNELVLKKINKAMMDLDENINKHYQNAKTHYQYLRFYEARQDFMIVAELSRDKNDVRYLDAIEKLRKLEDVK